MASSTFRARLDAALESPTLGVALDRALPNFRKMRNASFEGDDFRALQLELGSRKAWAIDHLPELVERFTHEAEKVGTRVHMARTAEEAREIVGRLARERGVKLVTKGKSMVTEEIGLNAYLESLGVRVVETDLGEWIIQLAGEHPSHLLAPALHKTREEIARLFSEYTHERIPDDIAELVKVARRSIRQSFIDADMGITGGNAGIAETGTLVLLENEGNGRMVSNLPDIHVALMGVEKIVPTMEDAMAMLKVLARSATGQRASSYVTFITGPSRSADIELSLAIGVHGPREQHIILVDNGRWAMRDDPRFREALQCIRCGACANVCPPFQVVSGHVFGHLYTGPIGLVITPFHHGIENVVEPQALCASCNACETVCPANIPLPRMILDVRAKAVETRGLSPLKRLVLNRVASPEGMPRLARLARLLQRPFSDGEFITQVPFMSGLTRWRNLPALAETPLRERLPRRAPGKPRFATPISGKRVAYFPGCITDYCYPAIGEAVARVVEACGGQVVYPPEGEVCCGLPAVNSGDVELACRMARANVERLERIQADYLLSSSTSCLVAMTDDYSRLLEEPWRARAQAVGSKLIDFTRFMYDVVALPDGALAVPDDADPPLVTYHDSCQSHNCLRLKPQQRHLIRDVLGLRLVEMDESSACCGFGGSFSFEHPRVAERVFAKKRAKLEATGATVVVTDNPGCILQLRGGLRAAGTPMRALHLAELMAERLSRCADANGGR